MPRTGLAALRPPSNIEPWYGPPRGFDFEREVQPVLDRYCVGCHNGKPQSENGAAPDLRARHLRPDYQGLPLSKLGADRLDPTISDTFLDCQPDNKLIGSKRILYTPAYDALNPLIRRVNIEDYVGLLVPAEYHADTSELIQMLQKGHHNVQLDAEAWDRLITWIDLNGPCRGTWGEVCTVPHGAAEHRHKLAQSYNSVATDPESVRKRSASLAEPVIPKPVAKDSATPISLADWPWSTARVLSRQRANVAWQKTVALPNGLELQLVRIPPGRFAMGSVDGDADETPQSPVTIEKGFWMSACEITNEQFQCFDPEHFSGLFTKRSLDANGPGIALNQPKQPVVRVSWDQAMAFCRWLSETTKLPFNLPTESEWEYACRAGSATPLWYGDLDTDFSNAANVADAAIHRIYDVTGGVVVLQDIPSDTRYDDGSIATANVGSYRSNPWGLFDMHGNAAEWTRSAYRSYTDHEDDRLSQQSSDDRRVVRGGSYYDRPKRCRSAFRLSYPRWQRVHNVGFRIVCTLPPRST